MESLVRARGHWPGSLFLLAVATLPPIWDAASSAQSEPGVDLDARRQTPRVNLPDAETARWARVALRGALRKLSREKCRKLLLDFQDAEGHTLATNLEALGKSVEDYLLELSFHDGADRGRCESVAVVARTTPGGRVIFICRGFARAARRGRGPVENIVIHEMLHTLGLGEDPPASSEINAAVARRCGP